MRNIVERLRSDFGLKTLGELIQERDAAAREIERLSVELAALRDSRTTKGRTPSDEIDRDVMQGRELLRLLDVCRVVGLSRSTIYKRVRDKSFPAPVQVSERSVRWRAADITEWLTSI